MKPKDKYVPVIRNRGKRRSCLNGCKFKSANWEIKQIRSLFMDATQWNLYFVFTDVYGNL